MMVAQIDPQVFLQLDYLVFFGFLATAVLIEIVSCGFPSIVYFLEIGKGLTVGVGMIARGEVGLLVVGMGFAVGVIPQNICVTLVVTCLATTIVSPFLLKAMRKDINSRKRKVSLAQKTRRHVKLLHLSSFVTCELSPESFYKHPLLG